MISEDQIRALSNHLRELQAELSAAVPLFQSIQAKIDVLSDVVEVMKIDLAQDLEARPYEEAAEVKFTDS